MRKPSPELRVIFTEEFRQQLRRRSFTVFTLVLAVLMLAAIPITPLIVDLMAEDGSEGEWSETMKSIGYIDQAGVLLVNGSQDSPKLYNDTAAGLHAVQQGEIDTLFILPADYLESGRVEEYKISGEGRTLWVTPAELAFEDFLRSKLIAGQLKEEYDNKTLARALEPAYYQKFTVEDDGAVSEEITTTAEVGELIIPLFFGALLIIAVLTGSGALLRSVYEEKETRMIEMLVTTASPQSIMTGKLLALWSTGLIQIAVWMTVGAFALPAIFHQIPNGGEVTVSAGLLTTLLLSFVLGYFLFSVLALLIAAIVSSTEAAYSFSGLMSVLMIMPMWLIGLFVNQPSGIMAEILTWFPFSAPTMLMVRPAIGSMMSSGEIAAVLGIIATTALLLLWVAARVFRAGILLSGQRITPGNVWRALRYAD